MSTGDMLPSELAAYYPCREIAIVGPSAKTPRDNRVHELDNHTVDVGDVIEYRYPEGTSERLFVLESHPQAVTCWKLERGYAHLTLDDLQNITENADHFHVYEDPYSLGFRGEDPDTNRS